MPYSPDSLDNPDNNTDALYIVPLQGDSLFIITIGCCPYSPNNLNNPYNNPYNNNPENNRITSSVTPVTPHPT